MPPWRSSRLSATVADWARLSARRWAAFSSACKAVQGESHVLAGVRDRVCRGGMSGDLKEGCCKARVGLQRTLESWGYGGTEQGSQPDLDPLAGLALLFPKHLV